MKAHLQLLLAFALSVGPNLAPGATDTVSDVVALRRTADSGRFINLSTRLLIGTGDRVGIAGFAIRGGAKRVIVRATGPSLTAFGVAGALADPTLELFDAAGRSLATNNDWAATQQAEIIASGFAPTHSAESAIVAVLGEGTYTAVVRGTGSATGVALVEVYDLDSVSSASRLVNLSTRGQVQAGDNVMIAGFVIGGSGARRVIIRGLAPSLSRYGVTGVLADPQVRLVAGNSELATNDDWHTLSSPRLIAAGLEPSVNAESALVVVLDPGEYTAIVSGVGGTGGNALVELYDDL